MSIELTSAVWKHSRQKSGGLLVLLAIADYANEDSIAWPGVPTLARKTRMSKRNVQRWLEALQGDGELKVFRNKGRHGSNLYKVCLPVAAEDRDVTHDTSDIGGAAHVTPTSSTNDAKVIQSVSKSSIQSSPVVPNGDDKDFWINVCFKCFGQAVHPIRMHVLRALRTAIPGLDKDHAGSLIEFYDSEPFDKKEPPYNSRRHSPERLITDLPRQLALAVQTCPPAKPRRRHDFTIQDVHDYLTEEYPGCYLPRSLDDVDHPSWGHLRAEIYDAMRERNRPNVDAT